MTNTYLPFIWILGNSILLLLGMAHLFLTFFTNSFSSKNTTVINEMKSSHPYLTDQTTIWKAWIGFNASHSLGPIFIGLINIYLCIYFPNIIFTSHMYMIFHLVIAGIYIFLAKTYWFQKPLVGISISFICFLITYLLFLIR